uniref:Glycosyl hydrolase family 31 C-terminal domain-containing protein n=1 Tax=Acrobeloides nanus TaxID=290746 RepID=A0A914DWN8_9BILA
MMVIPVINEGATSQNGYLPVDATWYSVYDYAYGTKVNGGNSNFSALNDSLIPVFVRGGYIIPRKRPDVTTTASRQREFQLLVALDKNNKANGELYWDDGDSVVDDISTYNNYRFEFSFSAQAQSSTLNITRTNKASCNDGVVQSDRIFEDPLVHVY